MFFENSAQTILDYLQHHLPDSPFDSALDPAFVAQLTSDFDDVDILEQIKAFRCSYDNQPVARVKNIRLALRRWICYAQSHASH